jgi:flavin reductase (DIM6/NTAB) family NADH-FMN oxidoreductase RutF
VDAGFDEIVAALDSAMVVVTTAAGDERDGCLVGFHSQCSIHPPRYAVWLSKANLTYRLASRASHLAVHAIGDADHDLADRFGGETGDEIDKLAGCEWTPGPGGAPLLAAASARIVGRITGISDDGFDHACFVIEPVEVSGRPPVRPLRLSDADDIVAGHDVDDR